jgi:hypothetical protein
MLKAVKTIAGDSTADDATRILGSLIHFGSKSHQCAYCRSTNTQIVGIDIADGFASAQIVCKQCRETDRPSISAETLKLILMHG